VKVDEGVDEVWNTGCDVEEEYHSVVKVEVHAIWHIHHPFLLTPIFSNIRKQTDSD
jgi:hypothetical protein